MRYLSLILIGAAFVFGLIVYPDLPARVPSHWNVYGEVDGYTSKTFGAFFGPALALGIYLLMMALPKIDPRKENYHKFTRAYTITRDVLVLLMLYIYLIAILAALGYVTDVGLFIRLGLGIMFMIMGNYLTQVKHNFFFGLRTPWTLANEQVFVKTHRLGGKLFVAAGIITLLTLFLTGKYAFVITVGSLLLAALIPAVYSYFLYQQERKSKI